jgi:histidinol-phosphate phosphatase family protein
MARRALFLDRDGTLIVDVGYPREPERVELIPGVAEVMAGLQKSWALVVISNQSGVGRGRITEAEAKAVHERFVQLFADAGVTFAGSYYCPHAPDAACRCRKPLPGMLQDAAAELDLDMPASVMIGDKESDAEAGRAAGCGRVIVLTPNDRWSDIARVLSQTGSGS